MGLWRPIAGPGVRHPDRPAGAARPLGSPAEERVEEGVGHGLRQEHHQEGYHLQGTQRGGIYRAEKKSLQNIFKQDPGRARQSS